MYLSPEDTRKLASNQTRIMARFGAEAGVYMLANIPREWGMPTHIVKGKGLHGVRPLPCDMFPDCTFKTLNMKEKRIPVVIICRNYCSVNYSLHGIVYWADPKKMYEINHGNNAILTEELSSNEQQKGAMHVSGT